jgi:hypothetical protein
LKGIVNQPYVLEGIKMKNKLFIIVALVLAFGGTAGAACMENAFLGTNVDDNGSYFTGFDLGTSSTYMLVDGRMIYDYDAACAGASSTSHIVAMIDRVPYDFQSVPDTGGFVQSGNTISGSVLFNGAVNVDAFFTFVNNPTTGVNADTMQYKFIATNRDIVPHNTALRLEIDTKVLENDGTNISIDNGATVITTNTVWRKSSGNVPSNWWDYDIDPHTGTPTLVGRGHIKNNVSGEPATEPDMFEVASWPEVDGDGQWNLAVPGDMIGEDSAVVYWWCNGDETSQGFQLNPGHSMTWIAYYGLNQGVLLATPTITSTSSMTPSVTFSATRTPVLTATVTPTITKTFTYTLTPTRTITNTFTITLTGTITMTQTVTPTVTETPPMFYMRDEGPFPNPTGGGTTVVYWISKAADITVRIFTVSGELVAEKKEGLKPKYYNSYYWGGSNRAEKNVASGIYLYKIMADDTSGHKLWVMGKVSILR